MSRTTHQVYKFEPGQCTCLVGDPGAGAQRVNVRKLSGKEAVLDPDIPLEENRYVYATIKLQDGPSFALNGLVVTSASGGILIQWTHSNPRETDRIDTILRAYVDARQRTAAMPPVEGAAIAPSAPPTVMPAVEPLAQLAPTTPAAPPKRAQSVAPVAAEAPLSVDAKLRKQAKRVRSSDLASRVETVQIINMGMIRTLVQESVDEALSLHGSLLAEEDKKRLLEEAEASFAERFSLFKAEKSGLETQINTLQDSLKKAQSLLEEERGKVLSANQFTVSDAGMVQLEQRLGRLLERALTAGRVAPELAEDMRAVVIKLLDDERSMIHQQAQQAQSDRLQLLERKVQRLASSLENAESERDLARERAQALEASGGSLRNVMKAGLDAGDPSRNRKLGLLKEIFKLNQEIRQKLAAEGRLAQPVLSESPPGQAEAQLASELGVKRRVVEVESEVADAADDRQVSNPEPNPDDLLWESPVESAESESSREAAVTFKRLGSGK